MSKVERANKRSLFRWIAAGSMAAFLITSSYQVSWGQGAGGNHIPQNNNNDEGLSSGEIAAIVVGGLAVGGGLFWLLGGRRRRKHHDEEEQKAMTLPAQQKSAQLRLVPSSDSVQVGDRDVFELQVKGEDGQWTSVTSDDSASIEVKDGDSSLVQLDGAKNIFCLPATAPSSVNGQKVTLVGHFRDMSAETQVTLLASAN